MFWRVHPQSKAPLAAWYRVLEHTNYRDFNALKETFRTADYVAPFTIFDIGGNRFRVVTAIHYNRGYVYVRHVFTHADYDRWSSSLKKPKRKA